MNTTVLNKKENPLLKRKEVELKVDSDIPLKTSEAEEIISKEFSSTPESVKIKRISGQFGSRCFVIKANVYDSKEEKEKTERKSKKEKANAGEKKE